MARRSKTLALVAGGVAGTTAILNTARVLAERTAVRRLRSRPDPLAGTQFDQLPSDRHYSVTATDGTPLYVEEVGPLDAPVTVVFAHGYCLEMGEFYFQRLALSETRDPQMRLVFFDHRSHGRSGHSTSEECTIDQLGSDLEQVIEAATDGERQVIVVGHSMGGMTIMGLADRRPELFGTRIAGTVLLSTSAGNLIAALRADLPSTVMQRLLPAFARTAHLAPRSIERGRRMVANTVWLVVRRYSFGKDDTPTSLADYVDGMISATPLDVVADFYPTLAGHDKVHALGAIGKAPALIVCGDEDRMTPIEHSELLASELPEADLLVVPGAGHMALMECPELVSDRLLAFIRETTSAGAKP